MNEEVMARALDPFYTNKGRGKGSGWPAAGYGFARQHGGTLRIESPARSPHHGSASTCRLRRATDRRDSAGPRRRAPPATAGLLLVEDDDEVRDTVSVALRAAGFEINSARTADEALLRLQTGERYDAVFTDVVMPGDLSGIELAQEIRRRYPRSASWWPPAIPIARSASKACARCPSPTTCSRRWTR
jgi:CheY-like chemotaxis protein